MFRINLFFLFVIVPIVEIALLIQVGQLLGFWSTLGLVILTAAIGSSIAAREGTAAINNLMQVGSEPVSTKIADAAIILVAGFLLLTPGIITDVVGLLGLFPITRPLIRNIAIAQFGKRVTVSQFGRSEFGYPDGTRQNTGDTHGRHPGTPNSSDGSSQSSGPVVGGTAATTPGYSKDLDHD